MSENETLLILETLLDLQAKVDCALKELTEIRRAQLLLAPAFVIGPIGQITQPNGATIMSGSQLPVTLPPVDLFLPTPESGWKTPGSYANNITVTNSDGTPPVVTSDTPSVATVVAGSPNGLTGAIPFTITAVAAGTANISISGDGVVDTIIPVTVAVNPDEVFAVDPTQGVISPPSP